MPSLRPDRGYTLQLVLRARRTERPPVPCRLVNVTAPAAFNTSDNDLCRLPTAVQLTACRGVCDGFDGLRVRPVSPAARPGALHQVRNNNSSGKLRVLIYTAIFEKNMRNSTLNYLIPDWSTAVT